MAIVCQIKMCPCRLTRQAYIIAIPSYVQHGVGLIHSLHCSKPITHNLRILESIIGCTVIMEEQHVLPVMQQV